jgi:hypothetical protein
VKPRQSDYGRRNTGDGTARDIRRGAASTGAGMVTVRQAPARGGQGLRLLPPKGATAGNSPEIGCCAFPGSGSRVYGGRMTAGGMSAMNSPATGSGSPDCLEKAAP